MAKPAEPILLSPPLSDADLAERLARADRWAQEAVYRKYVQTVWNLALRLLGNRVDAEELVRDTFAEALRDVSQARERRMLRSWLIGIAVQQAQHKLRRRRWLRMFGIGRGERTYRLDEQAGRSLDSTFASDLHKLGELLERMPARQRIAWCLRYMEACSVDEVAAYCGCSLATTRRELAVAHASVSKHIDITEPSDA